MRDNCYHFIHYKSNMQSDKANNGYWSHYIYWKDIIIHISYYQDIFLMYFIYMSNNNFEYYYKSNSYYYKVNILYWNLHRIHHHIYLYKLILEGNLFQLYSYIQYNHWVSLQYNLDNFHDNFRIFSNHQDRILYYIQTNKLILIGNQYQLLIYMSSNYHYQDHYNSNNFHDMPNKYWMYS